jgi:hypothetical protein
MKPTDTTDRADATVWLPLLHILGGVAERVASRNTKRPLPSADESGAQTPRSGGGA